MSENLVVGYDWKKRNDEWLPFLKIFDGSEFRSLFFDVNEEIAYERSSKKYCIGYRNNGEYFKCSENRVVSNGRRCPECKALDKSRKCIACDGSRCLLKDEDLRYRCKDTEMYVYLALIGDDIIKVGTASERRVPKRWINQGADYSTLIAEVTGTQRARRIEKSIYTRFDYASRVNVKDKVDRLGSRISFDAAKSMINKARERINEQMGHYESHYIDSEVIDLDKIYDLNFRRSPLKLNGDVVKGRVVGAKGQLLIIENNGNNYYYSLKKLIGRKLNSTQRPVQLQSSLDGF